jgi:hypothetical protein
MGPSSLASSKLRRSTDSWFRMYLLYFVVRAGVAVSGTRAVGSRAEWSVQPMDTSCYCYNFPVTVKDLQPVLKQSYSYF